MEGRNRAPWLADPNAWGRVRMTQDMASATTKAMRAYLNALVELHRGMPQPSDESKEVMREIRMVSKVVENVEGLQREKGWLPPQAT